MVIHGCDDDIYKTTAAALPTKILGLSSVRVLVPRSAFSRISHFSCLGHTFSLWSCWITLSFHPRRLRFNWTTRHLVSNASLRAGRPSLDASVLASNWSPCNVSRLAARQTLMDLFSSFILLLFNTAITYCDKNPTNRIGKSKSSEDGANKSP